MPRAVDYLKSAGIVLCSSIYRQRRWLRATFCFWKLNSSMLLILLWYRWHVFGVIKPSIIVNKYNGIRIPDQIMPLLHCRIWGQARTTIHSKETELEAMYVQSHNSSSSYIVNCNKKHKTIIFPTCSNCNKNKKCQKCCISPKWSCIHVHYQSCSLYRIVQGNNITQKQCYSVYKNGK